MISLRSQSLIFFNPGQYLPVHCQSTYPRPSCQSTNTCQSNANPLPIHLAVVFLYREQELYWDPPLVSTEDDFTPIPKTPILSQTCTNLSTHHQSTTSTIQCQCANQLPIQCQYNANTTRQMCSYLREQVSMGTHRWSRRRTISLWSQSPIRRAFFNPKWIGPGLWLESDIDTDARHKGGV